MNTLELARLQFGITTVFHFLFVPLTIGLAIFVAVCQTLHYRTGKDVYARMTRFWGKLMLISFAVGVVTGIVQEFQFGMNWSEYSRYVGDIFGAPLAMEALIAFFLESTFIGLWIFGRGKLSPKLHLVSIWAFAIGTTISAFFILAANSWMQHPVGYSFNEASGRAEMDSILKVLTNSTALYAFPHTILAALSTAAMVVLAVSAYHLLRKRETELFGRSARFALATALVATLATSTVGHFQGVLLEDQQPMKMAAAEALWETDEGVGLSVFAVSHFEHNPGHTNVNWKIPYVLSLLSNNDPNGEVRGMNDVQQEYRAKYGPGDYTPIVAITYWTFRIMIGAGVVVMLLTALGLLLARRRKLEVSPRYLKIMTFTFVLPFIANSAGWIFTEMGRQPWVVQGLLSTENASSPAVSSGEVAASVIGYTVIYGILAAIAGWLFIRSAKAGPKEPESEEAAKSTDLVLAY